MRSATESTSVKNYLGDLHIPMKNSGHFLRDLQIAELRMGGHYFDGLLGRDLIDQGSLFLNGVARTFTLSF